MAGNHCGALLERGAAQIHRQAAEAHDQTAEHFDEIARAPTDATD